MMGVIVNIYWQFIICWILRYLFVWLNSCNLENSAMRCVHFKFPFYVEQIWERLSEFMSTHVIRLCYMSIYGAHWPHNDTFGRTALFSYVLPLV